MSDPQDLLRTLAPQVLGYLAARHGQFDACEDAVQEALLAAHRQWPVEGVPSNPRGWLITVAQRRLTDEWRSDSARRDREHSWAATEPDRTVTDLTDAGHQGDDTLTVLFLCCHPALSPSSQIALTLRAVGGLDTARVARAFLVPETAMTRRITRAKQAIRDAGATFTLPAAADRAERLQAVRHVLYLIFNEGYTSSGGPSLISHELSAEAIRLTRLLHALLPEDADTTGLLALMLLTDAHRDARTDPSGALIPLAEQDRTRWDRAQIDEGTALVTAALTAAPPGPYQLQAAIAAVHAEATRAEGTDWAQIVALYRVLEHVAPNPMVTVNRAAAEGMLEGPRAGLDLLATVADDRRLAGNHRAVAVRAHLLEMAGEAAAARAAYLDAARLTASVPEQRYLQGRAARLSPTGMPEEHRDRSRSRR